MGIVGNLEVDVDFYRELYPDLQHMSDKELVKHYIIYGKKEGRQPNNLDVHLYRINNPELQHLTDAQLVEHYVTNDCGYYNNLDVTFYKSNYPDLQHMSNTQLMEHYITYGKKEGRLPNNVDVTFYKNNYPDLQHMTNKHLVEHYISFGKKEGRMPNNNNKVVNIVGLIKIACSFNDAFYAMVNYQKQLGYTVNIYDIHDISEIYNAINNIICVNPFDISEEMINKFKNKPAAMWFWEFKSLPQKYKDYEKYFSKIYLASDFCVDVFSAHLSIPVEKFNFVSKIHEYLHRIPNHIITNTHINNILTVTYNKVRYGFCFDINSSIIRKNPLNLVNAFVNLNDPNKVLIIKMRKARYGSFANRLEENIYNRFIEIVKTSGNIYLIDEELDILDLYKLYTYFDCYISPHCGEGYGLTIYDNMILGNPIISPYYSGERDFLEKGKFIELEYEEKEIEGLKEHPVYGQMSDFKGAYISVYNIYSAIKNSEHKITLQNLKYDGTYIVIDCQSLQHEVRGIGRYGTNLVNTIIGNTHFKIKLLINNFLPNYFLSNIHLREGVEIVTVTFTNVIAPEDPERNVINDYETEYVYETVLANVINKINPQIFLNLSEFDRYRVSVNMDLLNTSIKTFSILYDLIPLKMNWLPNMTINWKQNYMKQLDNLKKYNKLLSISDFTNKDCSDVFSNIVTIGTGAYIENKYFDKGQIEATLAKFNINKKYIFCQTAGGENKSLHLLVNQYKLLPDYIKNNLLLVLGCAIPTNYIEQHQLIQTNVIITGYLNEDDLWILHDNAWLFVFPSSYEGFGLPPVESMLHDKPVIVAKNTSLIEIMENERFMFNNNDNSCTDLITELYDNEHLYNECRDHCFSRKNIFTWDNVLINMLNTFGKYKISIILVLHNNKNWLNYIDNKFAELAQKYNLVFEYFIYENNSNTEFKSFLEKFMEGKNGKLLSEDIDSIKYDSIVSKERGLHMNFIRNKNKQNHGELDSDFTLLLDSDVYFNEMVIFQYIWHLVNNKKTSMITGYPLCRSISVVSAPQITHHYYDSLAFSTTQYNYTSNMNTCLLENCVNCKNYRTRNNLLIDESDLIKDGDIVHVTSAFGCAAMIPTKIYNNVNWNGNYGFEETDHYGFCQEVRNYGALIFDTNIKYIKRKDNMGIVLNDTYTKQFDKLAQIPYYYSKIEDQEIYYV